MGKLTTIGQAASHREQSSFSAKSRDQQTIYMDFEQAIVKSVSYNSSFDRNVINQIEFERIGEDSAFAVYDTAIPLLRGTVDQPVAGDVVLIYNIVDQESQEDNYFYLGPINTKNSPTKNPSIILSNKLAKVDRSIDTTRGQEFINNGYRIDFLDKLHSHKGKISSTLDYNDKYPDLMNSNKTNVGDMILEGRYGNSIRLGSRGDVPVSIISSGQGTMSTYEHINDDNVILLSSTGTIAQHLTLQSDNETDEIRFPLDNEDNVRHVNFVDEQVYSYNNPQMFFKSDRITLSTTTDKIFLLSGNSIVMNGLGNINIGTDEDIILDSETVFLGGVSDGITESGNREQAVLGNQLVGILEEILDLLGQLSDSYQVPLTDAKATPAATTTNLIKNKLTNILSEHIYIKRNQVK